MTIFRTQKNKNYSVVNNTIIYDKNLSWKAKGIWLYAFSRPDDWQFHQIDIINHSTDGKDAVLSGLKELEAAGYLHRTIERNEKGQFDSDWTFHEIPQNSNKDCQGGKPTAGNPPLLSTEDKLSTTSRLQIDEKSEDSPREREEPQAQQSSKNLLLQKKALLDKLHPAELSDTQQKNLCSNHTLSDLESAVNYYLLQDNIEKPYTWLSNCLRGKWWNDNPKELTQFTLFNSLKTALYALQQKIGNNLGIHTTKDYLFFNSPKGGLELKPQNLTCDTRIQEIVAFINDSFNVPYKLSYIKLPGTQQFQLT